MGTGGEEDLEDLDEEEDDGEIEGEEDVSRTQHIKDCHVVVK